MSSPAIATSKLVPARPPIGVIVSNRGAGRQTTWASDGAPSDNAIRPATTPIAVCLIMILVIEEDLFGVDDRPEQVFVGFTPGPRGVERVALSVDPRPGDIR